MAATALPALLPYAFTVGIGWMYYRRIRRQFGRQPWQPRRTMVRIALLSLVLASLVLAGIFVPHAGWAVTAGLAVGLGLGFYGVSLTEPRPGRWQLQLPAESMDRWGAFVAAHRAAGVAFPAWRAHAAAGGYRCESAHAGLRCDADRLLLHLFDRVADANAPARAATGVT